MIRTTRLLISALASAAMVAGLAAVPSSAAEPPRNTPAGGWSPAVTGRATQHSGPSTVDPGKLGSARQRTGAAAEDFTFTAPASAWSPDGSRLDLFQVIDGNLIHKFWDARGWTDWVLVGAPATSLLGTGASATYGIDQTRLDVFATGDDGHLYWITLTAAGWTPWSDVGGTLITGPSASSTVGGRIDVFGIGTDFRLYQKTWLGSGWSGWFGFDGPAAGEPSAPGVSWTANGGRIDVFLGGPDAGHPLYQKSWLASSGWSGWVNLGGNLVSYPSASWTGNGGRIDIFAMGTDFRLYQKTWTSSTGWLGWAGFEPPAAEAFGISATWTANGSRLDFFTAGLTDAHVYQMSWQASTGWVGWTDLM